MSDSHPPALTLKQRLAALHNASTSRLAMGPNSPPPSPLSKKIKLPWKRNNATSAIPTFSSTSGNGSAGSGTHQVHHQYTNVDGRDLEERQALQDVMTRLIFQAGVDYEYGYIGLSVSDVQALPNPSKVSYDLLLERILSYLNLYVESDYTLIFFAATAPGTVTPSWNWMWKAYRGLDRKWKKNLKRLLIVHPSFFSKMLISLAGAFISPKFNQKISYISTLSLLAKEVPLTQIDVPSSAYLENAKHEKKVELPNEGFGGLGHSRGNANRVFGVPLQEIMGYGGESGGIPRVVRDCIRTLREGAMREHGIFRRSPSTSMLNAAKDAYDRGNAISLTDFSRSDPHLCAVLLKKYLRDLPEPIFPEEMYGLIGRCPNPYHGADENESAWEAIRYIRDTILPEMVPCSAILLSAVLHVLHETSLHSEINQMNAYNLSVVITPNLIKGSNMIRDVSLCVVQGPTAHPASHNAAAENQATHKTTLATVIKLCIERYYEVFDETMDRGDAVPLSRSVFRSFAAEDEVRVSDGEEEDAPAFQVDHGHERRRTDEDEDEEIDDAMLIMPIAPPGHGRNGSTQGVPVATASGSNQKALANTHKSPSGSRRSSLQAKISIPHDSSTPSAFRPTHRTTLSKGSTSSVGSKARMAPSSFSYSAGAASPPSVSAPGTLGKAKARSVVSVDSGNRSSGIGGTMRRGSISVGTKGGTVRGKSGASGVEAVGVMAEGFFTAPARKN